MANKESANIIQTSTTVGSRNLTVSDLEGLPNSVKRWLNRSGILNREKTRTVSLKQRGQMRKTPSSKWMTFKATQHFNVTNASFVWQARVNTRSIVNLLARDKFIDGKGEMLIKLGGLIPVVNEKENHKINSATMLRYLSEICWFPSAATSDYIKWFPINENSAKAQLTLNKSQVFGIFTFSNEGDVLSFEAPRYFGGGNDAKLEKWIIKNQSFKVFNGIRIPNKSTVTWKLKTGDFHWLTVEIIELKQNIR